MEQCLEPAEKLGARGPGCRGAGTTGGKRCFGEDDVAGSLARYCAKNPSEKDVFGLGFPNVRAGPGSSSC